MVRRNRLFEFGPILLLAIFLSCSKLTSGGDGGDDGNSPFTIIDLRIAAVTDSSIQLKWTATGDDSSSGTADHYDIRYYRQFLNWSVWDSATQVVGEPAPSPSGQTDSMTVYGLREDSTYYFAIMAYDEAGNSSGISPCAHGTCFVDAVVSFPDPRLAAYIRGYFGLCDTCSIFRSRLLELSFFGDNHDSIAVLEGMQHCTNLTTIYLNGNLISDLTPISHLPRLIDIQFVDNRISDISPLSHLTTLEAIALLRNPISDISPLGNLIYLSKLDLRETGLSSDSGGIEPLRNLFNLQLLKLRHNNISDISALVGNIGLANGDTVDLVDNPLSTQSIDEFIPQLQGRGVTVFH